MGCFDPKSKEDVDKILKENNVEFHVEYFDNEEDWKEEIVRRKGLAFQDHFFACKVIPATIQTTFSVKVDV